VQELVVAHAAENMMQHQPVDDDKRFSQDIWTDMDVQEKAARTAVLHRYLKDPEVSPEFLPFGVVQTII